MAGGENTPSCVGFLLDFGRLEWQRTLTDLEKTSELLIKMFLLNLTMFSVSKVLLLLVKI